MNENMNKLYVNCGYAQCIFVFFKSVNFSYRFGTRLCKLRRIKFLEVFAARNRAFAVEYNINEIRVCLNIQGNKCSFTT